MTDEEIERIKARAEASTPGELIIMNAGDHTTGEIYDDYEDIIGWLAANVRRGDGPLFGVCIVEAGYEEDCRTVAITGNGPTSEANADFIVRARADVLKLVEERERLKAQVEEMSETLKQREW